MTTCAPRNSCGFSGSSTNGAQKWGSGSGACNPACLQCDCREFQHVYLGEDVIHVCKFGRYVLPAARFALTSGAAKVVTVTVPYDAPRGIVLDLGAVTADAVAGRPVMDTYSTYPAFAGPATQSPNATFLAPRFRVHNKSDFMVQVTTGVDGVLVNGISKQVGAQPGEVIDLIYHPPQNRWVMFAHYES